MIVGVLVCVQFFKEFVKIGSRDQETVMERSQKAFLHELVQLLQQQIIEPQIVIHCYRLEMKKEWLRKTMRAKRMLSSSFF